MFRKTAGDFSLIENLTLDEGDRFDFVVEDNAHIFVNIGAGPGAEFVRSGFLERETNLIFFAAGTGRICGSSSQLSAIDNCRRFNHDPFLWGRSFGIWFLRCQFSTFRVCEHAPIRGNISTAVQRSDCFFLSRIGLRGRGARWTDNVDKFQMRLTGQQLLHVLRVLHARHLQKDLVRVLPPMTRQRWLGNADSVDATLDDLHRLIGR